uniref:Uncharacterized protein n=1 Tax=Aegilops tauschii subsp. strangulata TaxID=200361 RepID=A0A453JR41_AEGTS
MARQTLTNGFLSGFMHVGLALVLLAYLPIAFLCRLVYRLLIRPFAAGEDLRGKVVLITGASSGIGEVKPGLRVREERRVRGAGGPDGDRAARRGQDGAGAGRAGHAGGAGGHHQRGRGQAGRRGDRRPLRQIESPGGQRGRVVQLLLRGDHQRIRLPERHGSQLLGRGVPDLLRAALPEGQPGQHRGHRLRGRQGPGGADELLQRQQGRGDPVLRDAAGGGGAARPRHHPHAGLRRLQPHHGQGRPEGRQRRLRRGGPRRTRRAAAGGEDGDAGGGGGGERAAGRPLRDVARVVLALPHGDVRRAGARRLLLQGLLRLQVQRQGRRRAQQEDPHGSRRQQVLPQEHPLPPVPI